MLSDTRYALRLLRRCPGFTLAAVVTLALGIGATTAIFTLVEAILLRPLPISEPHRVVALHLQEGDRLSRTFSYPTFVRHREQAGQIFEVVAGSGLRGFRVSVGNDTRLAQAAFVTEDYFRVAGIRVVHGRSFVGDEHRQGAGPAVVLTDAFWRTRMGGDVGAVGRQIRLADTQATIVGIAPRGFRGLQLASPVDVFIPMATAPMVLPPNNYFSESQINIGNQRFSPQLWIEITARLRPAVSIGQAEAVLSTSVASPGSGRQTNIRLVEASDAALSPRTLRETTRFAALLVIVVGLVLLVGCANLAGLILARNEQRRREAAVRLALGAPRARLVRLFITESLMVSLFGGIAGLLVATWMLQVMSAFVIPGGIRLESLQLGLSGRVLGFAGGAAIFTTLLAGVMPAIAGSRVDVVAGLKEQTRAATSGRSFARGALVAAQIAISLVLLVTSGLFIRSLRTALSTNVGTDTDRLAYATVGFASARYDPPMTARFYETMIGRLRKMGSVERVTFGGLPLVSSSGSDETFWIDGIKQHLSQTLQFHVGPDYFATVGIRLVAGRSFGNSDTANSPPVVIVNEAFARQAWPGHPALGRRVTFLPLAMNLEVIGIVADGRYANLHEQGGSAIFLPWQQNSRWARSAGTLIVRTDNPAGMVGLIQQAVREFDPNLPVTAAATMESRIAALAMTQRLGASFLSWFGIVALAVTVVGVYGLIAYAVARRTNEIGVRLALGAEARDVVTLMMRRSFVPVAIGVAAGLGGAWALTRIAAAFLFGIAPHDLLSFAGATLCLIVAAAVAAYIPARRASRVDPMIALRAE